MTISIINQKIQEQKDQLLQHSLYEKVKTIEDLQQFLESHVYAVWDFMSLLKALQSKLTCTTTPWFAYKNAETRYLINEIVLGEESDVDENGVRISHFELYIKAMNQMGANFQPIFELIDSLKSEHIFSAIDKANLHPKVKSFLHFTFDVALNAPTHVKAAVFTFGREDLIPDMFVEILQQIYKDHPEKVSTFKYYIERHIEVDGDHHSHLALEMVSQLCGDDESKWEEASRYSVESLKQRSLLWDAIIDR